MLRPGCWNPSCQASGTILGILTTPELHNHICNLSWVLRAFLSLTRRMHSDSGQVGQSGTYHALLTPLEIRSQRLRICREALIPGLCWVKEEQVDESDWSRQTHIAELHSQIPISDRELSLPQRNGLPSQPEFCLIATRLHGACMLPALTPTARC